MPVDEIQAILFALGQKLDRVHPVLEAHAASVASVNGAFGRASTLASGFRPRASICGIWSLRLTDR